jgi:hypothetical protein
MEIKSELDPLAAQLWGLTENEIALVEVSVSDKSRK